MATTVDELAADHDDRDDDIADDVDDVDARGALVVVDHDVDDVQMHDLGRYGVSGFTGLGLAWGALAVIVAVFGAPVTAGPSLLLLVVWLATWVGSATLINVALSRWQSRALRHRLTSSSSAGGEGTPTAIPGMRP